MKALIVAVIVAVMCTTITAYASEPPQVGIRVTIPSSTPLDDLPSDAERETTRILIRDRLFDQLGASLKYLDWTKGSSDKNTYLDATVKENDDGDLVLVFVGTLNGVKFAEDIRKNSIVLYDRYADVPSDRPVQLRTDLKAAIKGRLDDVVLHQLSNYFFSTIPLSGESLKLSGSSALVIPMSRSRLQVAPSSQFAVQFDDDATHGNLALRTLQSTSDQILCQLLAPPSTYGGVTAAFPKISGAFGTPPRAKNVQITMAEYRFDPNPGTANGIERK
jgi:hypothetical protein